MAGFGTTDIFVDGVQLDLSISNSQYYLSTCNEQSTFVYTKSVKHKLDTFELNIVPPET